MVGPSNYYIIPMARSYVYIIGRSADRPLSFHFLGSNGGMPVPNRSKLD